MAKGGYTRVRQPTPLHSPKSILGRSKETVRLLSQDGEREWNQIDHGLGGPSAGRLLVGQWTQLHGPTAIIVHASSVTATAT